MFTNHKIRGVISDWGKGSLVNSLLLVFEVTAFLWLLATACGSRYNNACAFVICKLAIHTAIDIKVRGLETHHVSA